MKYSEKRLSDTRVSLQVTVDADELKTAEQAAIGKLSKDVKVSGFRKGRVPANVAVKHIDQNLLGQQTLENALSRAMAEAFREADLQPLDQPQVEVKKFVPGSELEFTAEVDVLPEVKLGDYKKLKTKAEKVSVTATDVNEVIERLRNSLAESKEVKRAAKDGDEVVIDFVGKRDGEAFDGGTAKDYRLQLGSGQFIPGFEEAIAGHKAGEEFSIPLEFPKDYHAKDLQGAAVEFEVSLKTVNGRSLPAVDDEFAAKVGPFTSAEDLKKDIKAELTQQREREAGEKLKDELVKELSEASKLAIPEVLVDDQMQSIEQDFRQSLAYQGLELESYLETSNFKNEDDWRKKEIKPAAEKRVKSGLVLAELSKEFDIKVTEEEIDGHVEQYRAQYASSPEAAKQLETIEARRDITNRLITEKTVNQLVELNSK